MIHGCFEVYFRCDAKIYYIELVTHYRQSNFHPAHPFSNAHLFPLERCNHLLSHSISQKHSTRHKDPSRRRDHSIRLQHLLHPTSLHLANHPLDRSHRG